MVEIDLPTTRPVVIDNSKVMVGECGDGYAAAVVKHPSATSKAGERGEVSDSPTVEAERVLIAGAKAVHAYEDELNSDDEDADQ